MSTEEHARRSQAIVGRLIRLDLFRQSQTIHCYLSIRQEVNTEPIIRQAWRDGQQVLVPVVDWSTKSLRHSILTSFDVLEVGRCDLREPRDGARKFVHAAGCDLVIVPGVAFDRTGNRIGYGGGHYDGFLQEVSAPKIAPVFAFQLVEKLEPEAWDVRADVLVTEDEVVCIS